MKKILQDLSRMTPFSRAGQLQHTLRLRNSLRTRLRAALVCVYVCMYVCIYIYIYIYISVCVCVSVCACVCVCVCGPSSSVGIVTDYGLDGPGSNPGGGEIFRPSGPVLEPTQPPVQWVPGLSRG